MLPNISRYLGFFSHVCLQQFSVTCICNNDLLDFNRTVAESCCFTGFNCALSSKSMFFELLVLIPLVLYLIHSGWAEVSLNFVSRIRFKCSFLWRSEYQCMVHGFDSITITQFPAMMLLTRCISFFFWLLVHHFCLICVYYLVDYHSAPLSHN